VTAEAEAFTTMTDGKRILVVDDEQLVLGVVTNALAAEGYQVECAVNGQDALDRVKRQAPDVILLDLMMPVLDGRQLVRALREDPTTSQIPVIVLTAAYDAVKDPELASVVVVAKPFDIGMLLILLEDALRDDETPN